jgi:hypothetical protein
MLALLAATGCSADPVSYSAPVGITLKARSGDVTGTTITEDKSITTETSNPYGTFVNDARTKLGHDPLRIEVDRLSLTLGAQSTGVTKLEDVFLGAVDVSMIMNDTNNTYVVGSVVNPTGTGPVELDVALDGHSVAPQDFSKYLGGSFKVIARGSAATGFSSKGAEATLQLTFTYAAFD